MARSAPALSTFTAGEISPRLEGRVTISKYKEGLSELTNMIVHPHGGVTRRPGTEFLGEVKNSANFTRLIPFEFKTSDTYALEFGNTYLRVYRNGLQVLDSAKTISAITKANPGVLTSNSHGYSNGDEIFLSNTGAMTELTSRNYLVANVTTNTFTLTDLFGTAINTTGFSTFDSGVTTSKIFEVTTPYSTSDLPNVRFAQSADTMFLVHPSHAIRTLTRTDHNAWSLSTATISGAPSPNLNNSSDNYPSVVTFFEQRLVFGATNNNPQTLFFSKSADYTNFTVGTNDNDALIYTIASNKVNAIRYLSATRILTIGTAGGEFVLTTTNGGPVTPTSTVIRKYSNYGTTDTEPVQVADVTLFIQRGSRKVREFQYAGDININAYVAQDITILAEHITEGGLSEFAYQQEPESIIWALRNDGTLLGLTYRREEEVYAWHKHVIGGAFGSGQAVVESIMTLPTDSGEDNLFMIVKRTINSVTKRYVELLKPFNFGESSTSSFFLDSGLAYSGSSISTTSGLFHLEGQSVKILANGATHPDKTVSSGGITFDFSVTSAAIGLSYTSSMQTLRLEAGSVDGTSQGKPKRIHAVTLRLDKTVGLEIGTDSTNLDRIFFRDDSMDMDTAIPLFTGDKEIEFPGGFDDDAKLFVRQDQPLPMTILALFPRLNTFDI